MKITVLERLALCAALLAAVLVPWAVTIAAATPPMHNPGDPSRVGIPIALPDGLIWHAAQSDVSDRGFLFRAEDPGNEFRFVTVQGSRDVTFDPGVEPMRVAVRGRPGLAYNTGQGYAVVWREGTMNLILTASFGLSETLALLAQAPAARSAEDLWFRTP